MLRVVVMIGIASLVAIASGGCGRLGLNREVLNSPASTPTVESVPTFTLTTESDTVVNTAPESETTVILPTDTPTPDASVANSEGIEPVVDALLLLPTTTPVLSSPRLNVITDSVNVRSGPGSEYEVVDVVAQGSRFPLTGRNEQRDWWQVCCFEDQKGWLYGPLVELQNEEEVALAADIPPTPVATSTLPAVAQQVEQQEPVSQEPSAGTDVPAASPSDAGTAGDFNPDAQYQIVHYRVLGFDDNNGGIFNKGGQQLIFVTVLDQNGDGVNGAVVKDAVGDKLNVSVGNKGPGKAEIKMDWDPYRLYVAADPSGAVTSQISNQMNNPYPHIPDVIGLLGPADNEYAICPTVDDRCDPPFYHAHWSYEIIFQKVK